MRWPLTVMVISVLILLLALPASAHVPLLPGDHNSLATAMPIQNPAITYAIYGTLHEAGEADYYTVALQKGDTLNFEVSTPLQGSFSPWLVIAGPGLSPAGQVPQGIEVPAGNTEIIVTGVHPANADYEPFSPMAMYRTAHYTGNAPEDGTYVIAVYTPGDGGPYSLATGTLEAFTAQEWILVPVDLVGVRLWQGQSLLLIFGPYLAVLIIGTVLLFLRPGQRQMTPVAWSGFFAGLVYLGSGAAMLLQTGIALLMTTASLAVLVTLVFAAIAIGSGAVAVNASIQSPEPTPWRFRVLMALIGIAGLVGWAGLIIGPALAFGAALIPDRHR
jgi:hypothetical protein